MLAKIFLWAENYRKIEHNSISRRKLNQLSGELEEFASDLKKALLDEKSVVRIECGLSRKSAPLMTTRASLTCKLPV
jgi:hypothetical protein